VFELVHATVNAALIRGSLVRITRTGTCSNVNAALLQERLDAQEGI